MKILASYALSLVIGGASAAPHEHALAPVGTPPPCTDWPQTCPDSNASHPRAPYKQTWLMNLSTIIMPCNNTGYTDPATTKGWGIVDFDWSNGKGTGTADGWAKHKPMDDEEMLFKQVQMTTAATKGTTVWVYRNTVYGYPWYTDVRKTLEDPAYADWYIHFKKEGPWSNNKCDSANKTLCSDLFHEQEQSPGYPHGDGDCTAPQCDCGSVPCGFYVWNHSTTTVVKGQTFRDWFINDYILNEVGRSPLVSGFFWDDVWNPTCNIHDQTRNTCGDMGIGHEGKASPILTKLTLDYQANMKALREATLQAGKFAWQMLWTGGASDSIGGTGLHPLVSKGSCATAMRSLCDAKSPSQTRAMGYGMSGQPHSRSADLMQDLAGFLLIRGPYSWLGWGWKGCSQEYYFPPEFNQDYGEPVGGQLCKESAPNSEIFTREFTKSTVSLDCKAWKGSIKMK